MIKHRTAVAIHGCDTGMGCLKKPMAGFSLVEMMIAMLLGVIVVGGCIYIFTGTVRSSSMNQSISSLQGNGRFAMDMIGWDLRSAGFLGCAASQDAPVVISTDNAPTTNLAATAVSGAVIGASGWSPGTPLGFTPPTALGAPVVGTQALSVQYARFEGSPLLSSMSSRTDSIRLSQALDVPVASGDLMLISDCTRAELFEVDTVTGPAASRIIQPTDDLERAYLLSADYPGITRVMPFVSSIYYIGDTQRTSVSGDAVRSLFMQSYPYTAANPPLELVEGVEQMQLEFGIRQSDNSVKYVAADDSSYSSQNVETVRVGLLLSSADRFTTVDKTQVYMLAGRTVSPVGATQADAFYPADQRMRMPFNATFNVRNRSL